MQKPLPETWSLPTQIVKPWLDAEIFGKRVLLERGEYLYEQGLVSRHFYVIISGRIRVWMLQESGVEFVLEFMGPGSITGEGAAFDGQPCFSSAIAVERTETLRFEAGALEQAFRERPELATTLQYVSALKQRILAGRTHALTVHHPEVRICELLLRISSTEQGNRLEDEVQVVHSSLTHQQIAEMTGISRVTVTRVLGRLKKKGAIDLVDSNIVVRHPNLLY